MTTNIVILLLVLLAIAIAFVYARLQNSSSLFWRLLFCLSVSVCLSICLNASIVKKDNTYNFIDTQETNFNVSHTIALDTIIEFEASQAGIVGQDSIKDISFLKINSNTKDYILKGSNPPTNPFTIDSS